MRDPREALAKKDYGDVLRIFREEDVRFIVVGAIAAMVHGRVRMTRDLDLWVLANPENAARVVRALKRFGVPPDDVSEEDFQNGGIKLQIGAEPIRIDIITAVSGVKFEEAYPNIDIIDVDGLEVPVISMPDLIKNKKASGRLQDLADVEVLEAIHKKKNSSGEVT